MSNKKDSKWISNEETIEYNMAEIPNDVAIKMFDSLTRLNSGRRIAPLDHGNYISYNHREFYDDYNLMIGDVYIMIPPEFIHVSSESFSQQVQTLRQENSQKQKTGYHKRIINMSLIFNGMDEINGYKVPAPIHVDGSETTEYYYVDGLRTLLAQFKCTPFLPIENELLNVAYGIHTVALQSIVIESIDGFQNSLVAKLTLQEINMMPYIEMPDLMFKHTIDWDLYRYYTQSFLTENHVYKNLQSLPKNSDHNSFKISILNESALQGVIDTYTTTKEQTILEKILDDSNYECLVDSNESDIHITDFRCGYSNMLTSIQMSEASSPTLQYLGGLDTTFIITFETTNVDVIKNIEDCQIKNDLMIRNNPKIRGSIGFVKLETDIVAFCGSLFCTVESVETYTVQGVPGLYKVALSCVSYDITQSRREDLNGFLPFNGQESTINDIDESAKKFKEYENQCIDQSMRGLMTKIYQDNYAENKLRETMEVYPDLRLPKYDEVNQMIININNFRSRNGLDQLPYSIYPTQPTSISFGGNENIPDEMPNDWVDSYAYKGIWGEINNNVSYIDGSSPKENIYNGYVDPDFYVFYPNSYYSLNQEELKNNNIQEQSTGEIAGTTMIEPSNIKAGSANNVNEYKANLYDIDDTGSDIEVFIGILRHEVGHNYCAFSEGEIKDYLGNMYDGPGLITYALKQMGILPDNYQRLSCSKFDSIDILKKVSNKEIKRGDIITNITKNKCAVYLGKDDENNLTVIEVGSRDGVTENPLAYQPGYVYRILPLQEDYEYLGTSQSNPYISDGNQYPDENGNVQEKKEKKVDTMEGYKSSNSYGNDNTTNSINLTTNPTIVSGGTGDIENIKNNDLKNWAPITEKELNDWMDKNLSKKSPFQRNAKYFLEAAKITGLDPRFLVQQTFESGYGTYKEAFDKNNYYGLGVADGTKGKGYTFDASKYNGNKIACGIIEGAIRLEQWYYSSDHKQTSLYLMKHGGKTDPKTGKPWHTIGGVDDWDTVIAKRIATMPGANDKNKVSHSSNYSYNSSFNYTDKNKVKAVANTVLEGIVNETAKKTKLAVDALDKLAEIKNEAEANETSKKASVHTVYNVPKETVDKINANSDGSYVINSINTQNNASMGINDNSLNIKSSEYERRSQSELANKLAKVTTEPALNQADISNLKIEEPKELETSLNSDGKVELTKSRTMSTDEFNAIVLTIATECEGETVECKLAMAQLIYDLAQFNFGGNGLMLILKGGYFNIDKTSVEEKEVTEAKVAVKKVFQDGIRWKKNYRVLAFTSFNNGNDNNMNKDNKYDFIKSVNQHSFYGYDYSYAIKENKYSIKGVQYNIEGYGVTDCSSNYIAEKTTVTYNTNTINNSSSFGKPVYIKPNYYDSHASWVGKDYQQIASSISVRMNTSFVDECQYSGKGRLVRAFPTFLFCILDDQAQWYDGRKLWTNYYVYKPVVNIQYHAANDMPTETATITVTNTYHNLNRSSAAITNYSIKNDKDYGPINRFMFKNFGMIIGGTKITPRMIQMHSIIFNHTRLREGCRVHLRIGYGSDPLSLAPIINGTISGLQLGDTINIVVTSDGHELIQAITSDKQKDINDGALGLFGFGSTQEASNMISKIMVKRESWMNHMFFGKNWFEGSKYHIEHFGLYINSGKQYNFQGGIDTGMYEQYDLLMNIYHATTVKGLIHDYRHLPYMYDTRSIIGSRDGESNIVFNQYNMTPWDVFQLCAQTSPEFIVKAEKYQFDSRLFFGLPFDLTKYRYDVIDGNIYQECKSNTQMHYIDSIGNIIENQVSVSSRRSFTNAKVIYTRGSTPKATPIIHSDDTIDNSKQKTNVIDSCINQDYTGPDALYESLHIAKQGKESARRIGISNLLYGWQQQYQGQLICLGAPQIKPEDYLMINDTYANLNGLCIVREVVHSFSTSTGYTTSIVPGIIGFCKEQDSGNIELITNFLRLYVQFSQCSNDRKTLIDQCEKLKSTLSMFDKAVNSAMHNINFSKLSRVGGNFLGDAVKIGSNINKGKLVYDAIRAGKNAGGIIKGVKQIATLTKQWNAAFTHANTLIKARNAINVTKYLAHTTEAVESAEVIVQSGASAGVAGAAGVFTGGIAFLIFIAVDILLQNLIEWMENKNTITLLPLWWEGKPFISGIKDGEKILLISDENAGSDENTGEEGKETDPDEIALADGDEVSIADE